MNRDKAEKTAPAVCFHRPEEENGYLSNWYLSDFTLNGKTYCCAEQYMMEQKALLFGDRATAEQIMRTRDQHTMQELGRQVKPFVPQIWNGMRQLVVYRAILAKFRQDPELRKRLLDTGNALLVECAYKDRTWGAGMHMGDPDADKPDKWKGENLLGFTLMAVRDELKDTEV